MNLVVGSTGMLGGMITRRLIEFGKSVRVLGRQPSSIGWLRECCRRPQRSCVARARVPGCDGGHNHGEFCAARRRGQRRRRSICEGNRALIDAAKKMKGCSDSCSCRRRSWTPIARFLSLPRRRAPSSYLRESGLALDDCCTAHFSRRLVRPPRGQCARGRSARVARWWRSDAPFVHRRRRCGGIRSTSRR